MPPAHEMHRALRASDATYDGIFLTAVKTTGVFCRPSCRARKPRPENVEFFATVRDAMFAGYRACKRCRPLGDAPAWAARLLALADRGTRVRDADLRAHGIEPARARRHFRKEYGMTFQEYGRARRLGGALDALRRGARLDDAAVDGGYESLSGFRDAFARAFGATPGRGRGTRAIALARIDSPLGPLVAGAVDEGVCLLEFNDRRMLEAQLATLRRLFRRPILPGRHPHLDRLREELAEYFAGRRTSFGVPLAIPGTPFQQRVWAALRRIPHGETLGYGELARAIGAPRAVRAVGRANGLNRVAIVVPCHRVVAGDGTLGGYGGGLWRKARLLELERCPADGSTATVRSGGSADGAAAAERGGGLRVGSGRGS